MKQAICTGIFHQQIKKVISWEGVGYSGTTLNCITNIYKVNYAIVTSFDCINTPLCPSTVIER
jgi:hypothetical protein